MLVSCLAYPSTLKMVTTCSETLLNFHQTTQCYTREALQHITIMQSVFISLNVKNVSFLTILVS
jgi:hypothetical protein